MAVLVLWVLLYCLVGVIGDMRAARRVPASAAEPLPDDLKLLTDEETPVPVEWELLPADEAAERH